METKSQAKIAIRGKGSVKEGKGKSDAAHASNQDEDLHCLIMADTEEKIIKAKELIHQVIETVSENPNLASIFAHTNAFTSQAASIPEGQNELKRNQLRELAALNGTLRDDENQACQNCGEIGHRKYDCPNAKNFTANVICRVCGNAGHFARDCTERARGQDWRNLPARGSGDAADNEYEKLMNEIGGGTAGNPSRQIGWQEGGAGAGAPPPPGGPDVKPWQRGPTGGPAPWEVNKPSGGPAPWQQRPAPSGPSGGPAPWERSGGYGDRDHRGGDRGGDRGPAPWQQPRGHDNYGGHGGYGGGGGGYGQGGYGGHGGHAPPPAPGGPAPWMQQQPHAGYGAPGMDNNYGAPPPPPPGGAPPPPPPSDLPPPPPPPPQ